MEMLWPVFHMVQNFPKKEAYAVFHTQYKYLLKKKHEAQVRRKQYG
jgi:hypothetical protein